MMPIRSAWRICPSGRRVPGCRFDFVPLRDLAGGYDLVLADAPCSGSGAWRRQPEARWRLDAARLSALTDTQDAVLTAAAAQVRPGGWLAYATCSLLTAENRDRVEAFVQRTPRFALHRSLRLTPLDGGDGFYLARAHLLGLPVALCLAAGLWASDPQARMAAAVSGATFLALFLLIRGLAAVSAWRLRDQAAALSRIGEEDPAPCLSTDATGRIGWRNQAARERFGQDATLLAAFGSHFANPAAVLYRLQTRALNIGSAREDLSTRRGVTRLSAHRLGSGAFLWRLEEFADRTALGRGAETLSLPMLTANKSGVVLFSNEAMRRLLGQASQSVWTGCSPRKTCAFGRRGGGGGRRRPRARLSGRDRRAGREARDLSAARIPPRSMTACSADFEHVPVALVKFAPDGRLRAANRAARELSGSGCRIMRRSFQDLFEGLGRSVE
jgi:PAS domain-containing protein